MHKLWSLAAAAVLLAACETPPGSDGSAGGAGGKHGAGGSGVNENPYGDTGMGGAQELVENVPDRVFFGYDSSVLDGRDQGVLQLQAEWLKANPAITITVEGHADERGTREYNLALAERRANSVKNYLSRLGVNASRINTISYGKERPAVVGSSDAAWAKNRRGVTVIN